MNMSLRNKFLVPTMILVIVALAVSGGISYYVSSSALNHELENEFRRITRSTSNTLDLWIRERVLNITTWSRDEEYIQALESAGDPQAARKRADGLLRRMNKDYTYYETVAVADTKGNVVSASLDGVVGKINIGSREYFQMSMSGQLVVSEAMKSKATGNAIFTVSAPVKSDNQIVGVLFGIVNLSSFSDQFVKTFKLGKTGYAYIVDGNGTVLAHPDESKILTTNMKEYEFGREMVAQKEGLITYETDGKERIVGFRQAVAVDWIFAVGAETSEILAPVHRMAYINMIVGIITVVLGLVLIFLVARSITGSLNRSIQGLSAGADDVASASQQISQSSLQLSESTSEQAASLEETSSSLEEMSSMVKATADNASQADGVTAESGQVVKRVTKDMEEMAQSMAAIAESGAQIGKVVKSIDEIAFQTNLLALNAAVEAARAGEAGMGFAVVADEVRALAMRAADAAKNTQELVQDTVNRINRGSELVSRTQEGFADITKSSGRLQTLIGEIAAASGEQAQGIGQINQAMAEMDKVVQGNSANSEEMAAAARQMMSQSEAMRSHVEGLVRQVRGGGAGAAPAAGTGGTRRRRKAAPAAFASPVRSKYATREVDPSRVLPLDGDDLDEF